MMMKTYKIYFSISQDSSKQKQITILSFDRLYTTCVVDVKLTCSNFMLSLLVYTVVLLLNIVVNVRWFIVFGGCWWVRYYLIRYFSRFHVTSWNENTNILLTENFYDDSALRLLVPAFGHTLVHACMVDVSIVDCECRRGLVTLADADVWSPWHELVPIGCKPVYFLSISNNWNQRQTDREREDTVTDRQLIGCEANCTFALNAFKQPVYSINLNLCGISVCKIHPLQNRSFDSRTESTIYR